MLVTGVNVLDLDTCRHDQLARVVDGQAATADQPRADTRLLAHLADGGVVGQLVVLDVAAGRQPLAQFAVVVQQHALVVDHENGHREVAQQLTGCDRRMLGHGAGWASLSSGA